MVQRSLAKARLKRMVAWDSVPTLTDSDIDELLDIGRRVDYLGNTIDSYDEWESTTAYAVGDRVVPTELDGVSFACSTAGTTGASEPTWADGVTDGTVVWAEDEGAAWIPTYDLNLSAAEGWRWKAAKAATLTGFTADGATFHEEQIIANCERMVARYAKGGAGSLTIGSRPPMSLFTTSIGNG